MRNRVCHLFACALLCSAMTLAHAGIIVTDATGAQIRLTAPTQRVVSLAPHITELVYAAGAGGKLVGNVDFGNYPLGAEARRLRRVAH